MPRPTGQRIVLWQRTYDGINPKTWLLINSHSRMTNFLDRHMTSNGNKAKSCWYVPWNCSIVRGQWRLEKHIIQTRTLMVLFGRSERRGTRTWHWLWADRSDARPARSPPSHAESPPRRRPCFFDPHMFGLHLLLISFYTYADLSRGQIECYIWYQHT